MSTQLAPAKAGAIFVGGHNIARPVANLGASALNAGKSNQSGSGMASDRPNSDDVAQPPFGAAAACSRRRRGRRHAVRRACIRAGSDAPEPDRPDPAQRISGRAMITAFAPCGCRSRRCRPWRRRRCRRPRRRFPALRPRSGEGGWAFVPPTDRLRLGNRHPSVVGIAPAPDRGRRSRHQCGLVRRVRFLCRGRGASASRRGTG